MISRCKLCLYPDTKPDLPFDPEGVCAACRNYANRPEIDWKQREQELVKILETAPKNGSGFDCVVASSGGKDSHFQVLTLLTLGARPLVVTASTCLLTPWGRANIDNLSCYATTIEYTPNREVRWKLNRLGLELVGDISWPEHAAIFSIPMRVARREGIPLVFYGENPQREYGGPLGSEQAREMTYRWISEFGGFLGLRPADFIGRGGIEAADMLDYHLPEPDLSKPLGQTYFLGQFIPWDSHENAKAAKMAGMFQPIVPPSTANFWTHENLDNAMTGLHDHGMYRKYGYGRLVAQVSHDIRRGLITRPEGLRLAKRYDGAFPSVYAGVPIGEVLERVEMSQDELLEALDAHTNWGLFKTTKAHRPILKEDEHEEVSD